MNDEALNKLIKARVRLLMSDRFFGNLILTLPFIERNDLPVRTMAVDGVHLFYDREFVLKSPLNDLSFILAHEAVHILLLHISRRNGRDYNRWSHAIDYAANAILVDSGMKCPATGLFDPAFAGMSAEEIYNKMPAHPPSGKKPLDDCFDAPVEKSHLERTITMRVIQSANDCRRHGKLPGNIERMIAKITRDENDWRARLQRFAQQFAPIEPSWNRFNRRWVSQGVYLPGLNGTRMGTMVVVIDDSGSINETVLAAFTAETAAARAAAHPQKTYVLTCDARVNHTAVFDEYDELKIESHGGGGTDFRPPFKWLSEQGVEPDCLIYLTDGYGRFPDTPAAFPVLWCMTSDVVAPWGDTVEIELKE